jgi:hypothetical protein
MEVQPGFLALFGWFVSPTNFIHFRLLNVTIHLLFGTTDASRLSSATSTGRPLRFDTPSAGIPAQPDQGFTQWRHSRRHKESTHIPQPPGSFLIYHSDYCATHPLEINQPEMSKVTAKEPKKLTVAEKGPHEGRAALTETTHVLTHPDYRYQPRRKSTIVQQKADLVCHPDGLVGRSNKSTMMSAKETSPDKVVQAVQDQSYYGFDVESATPSVSDSISALYCSPVSNPLVFDVEEVCHY